MSRTTHDDDTTRIADAVAPANTPATPAVHHTESEEETELRTKRDAAVAKGDANEAARLGELYILALRKRSSLGDLK